MNTLRSSRTEILCFSLVLGFALQTGLAKPPAPPTPASPDTTNRIMTFDVVVTDKSGNPIPGLQQQNFTLLDNNQPQKIGSFRAVKRGTAASDPPVEMIILIDQVNASVKQVAYTRDAVERFLGRNGGKLALPISTAFFSDTGTAFAVKPSQDGNAIIADLNQQKIGLRVINRSKGVDGAEERWDLSQKTIKQIAEYELKRPGRKLLVWISPGWPMLSGPNIQFPSKQQQRLLDSVVSLSDELRQARITLYAIDPLGTDDAGGFQTEFYKLFVNGVKKPAEVRPGHLALQVLAIQSGGLVLNSNNDVAGEIAACERDAGTFYVITYNGRPGGVPSEYRALAIKMDKPGLTARTRAGYYAQPENPAR